MAQASGKGGYQAPSKTGQVAGPGRFSKRTDTQPVNTPGLMDSEDLKHGDIQKLEAAQRAVPLQRQSAPRVVSGGAGGAMAAGMASDPFANVFGGESTRPGEPLTEGLPFGPGGGPEGLPNPPEPDDDREFVLHMLSGPPFNNERVRQMYQDLQAERRPAPMAPPEMMSAPDPAPELVPAEVPLEEPEPLESEMMEEPLEGGEPSPPTSPTSPLV